MIVDKLILNKNLQNYYAQRLRYKLYEYADRAYNQDDEIQVLIVREFIVTFDMYGDKILEDRHFLATDSFETIKTEMIKLVHEKAGEIWGGSWDIPHKK